MIDGAAYNVADEVTWTPGAPVRESLKGLSGIPGYSEVPNPGKITAKIFDAFDLSINTLAALTDSTVQVLAANGKNVTGSGMWVTEALAVSGKEGSFEITFEGPNVSDAGYAAA
jgi:hypothetical protein